MAAETVLAAMIDITVKTMDGNNRTFSVPEDLNVRQFKEKIGSSVEISADTQRLIFQGRVMQDDQILKDYNIHGKVIHLVQRAPPSLSGPSTARPTTTSSAARPQIHLDGNRLGRVQSTPNTSEARARIRQAEFNLRIVNDVLIQLQFTQPGEHDGEENLSSRHASRPASSFTATNFSENRTDTSRADQPLLPGQETSNQQVGLTAAELASFLDQVLDTMNRVMTSIQQYQSLLRNEKNYPPNSREAQDAQDVVNRMAEIFHAVGHMMHNLSDVTVNMSTSVPRQAVALSLAPFQIPGAPGMAPPIHVTVRSRQDSNRGGGRQRPRQQTSTAATPGSTNTTTSAATPAPNSNVCAEPGVNTTTESTTNTTVFSTFQNITPSGDSGARIDVFPTNVTIHDVTTVVTQELDADTDSNSDSTSTDSDDSATENRTRIRVRPSLNRPAAAPSSSSKTKSSVPSTAASSPPQRPGTTFTSSTSTSSTITFEQASGMDLPQMSGVPGLPSGFLQNMFGSLLNTHGGGFPGQPVQVSVVQEVTTSEETSSTPEQQQQQPNLEQPLISNRSGPNSRERLNQKHSSTACAPDPGKGTASPKTKSCKDANTATSTGKVSSTSTVPTSNNTTSVPTPTINTPSMSAQSSNIGPRPHSNLGVHSRPFNLPRPRPFPLLNTRQTRQQPVPGRPQQPESLLPMLLPHMHRQTQGYIDPYLPCASSQYLSQTAQAAVSALQGQAGGAHQQAPNLNDLGAMLSGMVGEILGQASQQAVNPGAGTNTGNFSTMPNSSSSAPAAATTTSPGSGFPPMPLNPLELLSHLLGRTSTNTMPNSSPSLATTGVTATNAGSGQPSTAPNPLELLSQLLGGAGQVNAVPPEFGAMINSLMQAMGAPSATTNTSSGNAATATTVTMADLLSHFRSLREDRACDAGILTQLLETVAPHIGLADLFSLVMGNGQVLNQVREPLQEFLKRLVNQHDSVEQVVEVALNDMSADIRHLQDLADVKDGVDMATSVSNCLRTHLQVLVTAIHCDMMGPVENFGTLLLNMLKTMLEELIRLCVYCIRGGYTGFLNMLQSYVPHITHDMSPAFSSWMTIALQSTLESFYHNNLVPESDIIGYVVNRPRRTAVSSSFQEQNMCNSKTSLSSSSVPANLIRTPPSVVNHDDLSEPSFPSTTTSPDSQPPRENIPRGEQVDEAHEPFEDAQEALACHQPPITHPSTLATSVTHTMRGAAGNTVVKNSDEWQSVVPQDWIPVISQDIVRQQEQRPQPSHSDAYIQGLPAKRRRMMSLRHSHGMGNMLQYLPDSLERAAKTAGAKPCSSEEIMAQEAAEDLDLQAELEEELTALLEARLLSDQDFSLDRFPNAEQYFHKPKP